MEEVKVAMVNEGAKDRVIIREYKKQDHKALAHIVMKTWHYDEFAAPKAAIQMGRLFLNGCLLNQTFVRVAELDGKPIGVIMGKNKKDYELKFSRKIKCIGSYLKLMMYKDGRKNINIFGNVNEIDEKLLEDSKKDYMGEVAFFAIDSRYRGLGLGRKLFDSVVSYMKKTQVDDFFLFTDTSCNYQFYEHLGMTRRAERCKTITVEGGSKDMHFFIYDYQL